MSPTYTAPAIETIHQGEQLFTSDNSHHQHHHYRDVPLSSRSVDGPRSRARASSLRSHTYGKKHRSGSPQVHPSLKASPVAVDDAARRASSLLVPKTHTRRHASVDFSMLKDPSTGLASWCRPSTVEDNVKEVGEWKRARLSPSLRRPTAPRSLSDNRADLELERSSDSVSKETQNVWHEYRDEAARGASSDPEVSSETAVAASRYLKESPQTRNARRPSWPGQDGKILSPTPCSSSPGSSQTSTPSSVASSHTTVDSESNTSGPEPNGQGTPIASTSGNARTATNNSRRSADPDRYGTPEMPRGSAKLPHIPTIDLTPRVPTVSQHPKHLPRAEKLPMSGYELLASTISSSAVPSVSRNRVSTFLDAPPSAWRGTGSRRRHSSASASFFNSQPSAAMAPPPQEAEEEERTIKPIYRRFEALNHRLLLHLQDELSELEEQLHRLDTTDTQTRRLQSSILPASRRAEFLVGGELQSHKAEILSKIAFKLGQYNHALSSFTSTRDLPAPAISAVTEYRDYLATHRPISDVETRFLDSTDDLVTLEAGPASPQSSSASAPADGSDPRPPTSGEYLHSLHLPADDEAPIVTPIPGTMHGNSWLVRHNRLSGSRGSSATSSSPRFARPTILGLEQPLPSPRLPSSPLRRQHRPDAVLLSAEEKDSSKSGTLAAVAERGTTPLPWPSAHVTLHLALALAMAVAVPVLAFSIIPGFVARMMVVLMVGVSVVGSMAQAVDLQRATELKGDLICSGAVYAGVMAIVAGIMV